MARYLVWLSWGVDSALVASMLCDQWHDVVCGFMITYRDDTPRCTTRHDLASARAVADFLWCPLHLFDYREEYHTRIIAMMVAEYRRGRTPNPDVWCNSMIKFDLFAEDAKLLAVDAIATGHYASLIDGWLYPGHDMIKDQSYFLSRMSRDQRQFALFPLGVMTKDEVRIRARERRLPNADRPDSQWLCFVGNVSIREFLRPWIESAPWPIITSDGTTLGMHTGAWQWTRGQRRGLWLPPEWYVYQTDVVTNTVFVCHKDEKSLWSDRFVCDDWVWHEEPDLWVDRPLVGKVRSRMARSSCVMDSHQTIVFATPVWGVACGQVCTIADAQTGKIVGSWIISSVQPQW